SCRYWFIILSTVLSPMRRSAATSFCLRRQLRHRWITCCLVSFETFFFLLARAMAVDRLYHLGHDRVGALIRIKFGRDKHQ
ncbi:hypothetical protein DFH08DRAFT_886942, partial [Mycena albidolilacea]